MLAIAVTLAVVHADAAAATTFRGHTAQGRRAIVHVDSTGRVRSAVMFWRAPCARPRSHVVEATKYTFPARTSLRGRLASVGGYHVRDAGGFRLSIHTRLFGRRVSPYAWRGSLRVRVTVRRHGSVADHCRLGRTRWRAGAPEARLTMVSDPGDYIGQGQRYAWATPAQRITLSGTSKEIHAAAGGFMLDFAAARGHRLRAGAHFPHAIRYPFNERRAGLSIAGRGRGCNEVTGSFRVLRARFAGRGVIRAIELRFEQHCEGGAPALRGTLFWRRH